MTQGEALSVLVVDEEPSVLVFLASLLDNNGIRALLAHSAQEAEEIARRGYVPIDLVLTDIVVKDSGGDAAAAEISGAELINRLRRIRPDVRSLYMTAFIDAGVIRIQLMSRRQDREGENFDPGDLISSIRAAAVAPLAFRGGSGPQ